MNDEIQYDERSARHQTKSLSLSVFLGAAGLGLTLGGGLVNVYDGVRVSIADNARGLAVLSAECVATRGRVDRIADAAQSAEHAASGLVRSVTSLEAEADFISQRLSKLED